MSEQHNDQATAAKMRYATHLSSAINATAIARSEGIREAAVHIECTANLSADALRLKYGEMSAQEIRTLRAVLEQQADAIMRMANIEVGDPDGEADVA